MNTNVVLLAIQELGVELRDVGRFERLAGAVGAVDIVPRTRFFILHSYRALPLPGLRKFISTIRYGTPSI